MTPEQFLMLLVSWWPWVFLKIVIFVLALFYTIFAAICLRQTDLMNQMVEAQISPVLRLIAIVHLGAAIFLLILALFLL